MDMTTHNSSDSAKENIIEINGECPESSQMVLESQEIDCLEHEIIKGDTIGSTVYSAKWILKTLISLSNIYENGWNESIENEICMLWDTTLEKDIVHFLLQNGFLKIAEFNLRETKEPRLIEILVGIIGNMCCESKTLEALLSMDGLTSEILYLSSSSDTETVIQVMRILQAIVWIIKIDNSSLWVYKLKECPFLGEALIFILKNSVTDDLLTSCIDLIYLVTEVCLEMKDKFMEDIFIIDELIFALCEAILELTNHNHHSQSEIYLKNLENWCNIIFNLMKKELLVFKDDNDANFIKINSVLIQALTPFTIINNLVPLEEKAAFCIQQCVEMVFWFQKNNMSPSTNFVVVAVSIMRNLKTESDEEHCENFTKDLYKFIKSYWMSTIQILSIDQILNILENYDHNTIKIIAEESSFQSDDLKFNINQLLETKLKL